MSGAVPRYTRRRLLTAVIVTVIVVGSTTFLVTYLLSSQVTRQRGPTISVQDDFLSHLQELSTVRLSRNLTIISQAYQDNASLVWIGRIPPAPPVRSQTFNGKSNISANWCNMFCESTPFTFKNVTYVVRASGNRASVNATFDLDASPSVAIPGCNLRLPLPSAPIAATLAFVRAGDRWLISSEAWEFQFANWPLCSTVGT